MIKAAILDFDGTLVTKDILDVVCGIAGKEEESRKINEEFHQGKRAGLDSLIERINFLQGVSLSQIEQKLNEDAYLMKGAKELLEYFRSHRILTILSSGNILPVLQYYQKILGFTHIIGSAPKVEADVITGISQQDFRDRNFKIEGVKKILEEHAIPPEMTLAVGDSPADRKLFDFAHVSIAINPKEGVGEYANYVIWDDLSLAIPIIEKDL